MSDCSGRAWGYLYVLYYSSDKFHIQYYDNYRVTFVLAYCYLVYVFCAQNCDFKVSSAINNRCTDNLAHAGTDDLYLVRNYIIIESIAMASLYIGV